MEYIVFVTQYRENYGAHNWDGEGECPQYWKNKGGYTYILKDASLEEAREVSRLLEYYDDYSQEYVINVIKTDDFKEYLEEWDEPIFIELKDDKLIRMNVETKI